MNNHAAIYARVSTDDQADKGYSLPSQIEACQRFADQKGFDLVAIYQDDISGAKSVRSRPEGRQLQDTIDSSQVNVVIVYQTDRLSRDIVDLLMTVRDWLQAGIEIYALDVGQVTSELDIVLVIKGWQGSDERKKILERTTRGRNAKARAGKVVGCGTPPYGYRYEDGEFLIEESEAKTIRMIYDLYINGRDDGKLLGLPALANHLTKVGIPTPTDGKRGKKKNAVVGRWSVSAVYRILTAETYCGFLHYGKLIGWGGTKGKRPPEEHIIINVPPIVSQRIWQLAQERRAYNFKMGKRRTKREYLLRGLIYCGCGRHLVGTEGSYYCTARARNHIIPTTCKEPRVDGQLVEEATWNYVINLITVPEQFEDRLREAQTQELQSMRPKQIEVDHVIALIRDTEKEADEIAWAITKSKGLVADRLEQQADEINRRYQALTTRLTELQEALDFEFTDSNIDNLLKFREVVATGLQNPTIEDKRRWLELLQVTITVKDRHAIIECRISSEPAAFNLEALEHIFIEEQGETSEFHTSTDRRKPSSSC